MLYRLGSATITAPVNIFSINTLFTIFYQTTTDIYFQDSLTPNSCSFSASFTSDPDKENWLPLAVTYDGNKLRAFRLEETAETACPG